MSYLWLGCRLWWEAVSLCKGDAHFTATFLALHLMLATVALFLYKMWTVFPGVVAGFGAGIVVFGMAFAILYKGVRDEHSE